MPDDVHDEIAALEAEIEAMARSAELCRTMIRAGKVAVAGGVSILVAGTALLTLPPVGLLLGIAAVVGGIVVAGSNKGTLDELAEAIGAHERHRTALIDGIDLRAVDRAAIRALGHMDHETGRDRRHPAGPIR